MAFYSKDIDLYAKDAMLNYIRSQQTEFEVVQGKITALISESELEELEDGHTTMYSRLADVELRADGFDAEFSQMDTKYNSITGEITAMDSRLATFSAGLNGLDSKITQTNTNLQNNYWTATRTSTEIQQSAESIMLQVSSGYASKSESVSAVVVEYAVGTSSTTAPTSGWSSNSPTWTSGKYIWQRTAITKNGSTTYSNVTCIQGAQGENGTSVSVSSIQYQQGDSATTAPTGSWSNSPVAVTQGKYLWTKTTYSNGSVAYAVSRQGVNGADGTSVSVSSVQYQQGDSPTTAPTGTWSSSPVTVEQGKYLWTKTTYSNSSVAYTVSRQGVDGTQGDDGVGISTVKAQYYLSSSKTSQTGGSWSDTPPEWVQGKYLWTRSHITYTDGTTSTTTPVLDQVNTDLEERMASAELKITPDAIVSTVKQYSDVQCINLLSLSDLNEYSTTIKINGYNASISLSASATGGVRVPYTITETGKKYTLSFKFKKKNGELRNIGYTTSSAYTVHRFAVDGVEQSGNLVTVADDQTEHSVVITFTRSSNLSFIIRLNSGASVAVEIDTWEWQLEKGEFATGWTPAIEDTTAYTQSMISQSATEIYAYADTIRLKAATLVWQASNSSMDSTGKLTCTSATIGGINVNTTSIYSTGYTSGGTTNGFKLSNTGTFEWKATYSSLGSDGKLTISNAAIGTGNASPIYIGNGKIYSGLHTTYDSSNQGFYLGGDGKFGIGDSSSYMRWTGSELNFSGNIVAKSLTLGNGVAVPASGVSGLASVATSGEYTDLANKPDLKVYISKGGTVGSTPQEGTTGFVVSTSGLLTCSNAVVYGTIYSSNGTIGGIKILSGNIHTGSKTAYSSTSQGFYLGSDGTLGVGDGSYYLRWDGSNLNLSVSTFSWSATYSSLSTNGKLTITSAEIGNTSGSEIKIGNGYIYSGSHSSYASSYQGFYFDGNGYFGIGDSNYYLRWNKSDLDIKVKNFSWNSTYSNLSTTGKFECTYGNIGGIKIASDGIYATNGTLVTAIDANIGKIHVYRRISTSGSDFLLPSVNYSYFCASTNGVEATAVSTSSFSVGALPSDLSGDSSIGSIYFDVDSGGLGCYVDAYFNRVCIGNKSTSYGFYCTLSSYFSGEVVFNDNVRLLGGRALRFGSSSANGFISDSGSIKLSLGAAVNSGSAIVSDSNGRMKTLSSSSKRYKNYLGELPDEDAERLLNLPVIEFVYKPGYLDPEDAGNGKKFAGLFAEDVAGQFDDAAFKKDGLVENYSDRQLLVRLIKLCQIQQKEIDELKSQIAVSA